MADTADTKVQLVGFRSLRSAMKKAGNDTQWLNKAFSDAAAAVASRASGAAPHVSGALAGSIRSSGTKTTGFVRAGRAIVPYANPIHWGWLKRGIRRNAFITESARDMEQQTLATVESAVNDEIKYLESQDKE